MEKFVKFAQKYNLKELLLIFFVGLILFILYYGKQGAYMVDVGREAYIPWQMLQGKLLYKDIFNVYGPLGYQINAIAYAIFGINLNTLYLMGFLNSLVILFTTFFISKFFTDKKTALSIVGLTMLVCVYAKGFFNFIFVYSYSAVYALSGFLLSLLAMLFFMRDKKNVYLIWSFVFAGFSFANKIEYLPYFCLLFLILPLFKLNWKQYAVAFASFMLFPVISVGCLLLQGVSIKDLVDASIYIKKLVETPAVEYFYNAYGLYYNPLHVDLALRYLFTKFLPVLAFSGVVLYGLNFGISKFSENKFLKTLLNFSIVFFMLVANIKLFDKFQVNAQNTFNWIALVSIAIVFAVILFYVVKIVKNKIQSKDWMSNIALNDKMFLFLFLAALSVSVKGFSDVTLECYGTFSLAAIFIPFVIFFVCYIPRMLKFVDAEAWTKTIRNLCFMVVIAYLFFNVHRIGTNPIYLVKTDRGRVFVDYWLKSQNNLLNYIVQNTSKDSVIVSIPEGAIINFLTERKSHDYYYYLIPVNMQVFGEQRVLSDFKKNPPDYVILNNVQYTPFNVGTFCDYAPEICDFVLKNYTPVYGTNDKLGCILYKKK